VWQCVGYNYDSTSSSTRFLGSANNVTIELFDDVGAFLCKMATIKRQYDQNCCQPTAAIALTTVGYAVEWCSCNHHRVSEECGACRPPLAATRGRRQHDSQLTCNTCYKLSSLILAVFVLRRRRADIYGRQLCIHRRPAT